MFLSNTNNLYIIICFQVNNYNNNNKKKPSSATEILSNE